MPHMTGISEVKYSYSGRQNRYVAYMAINFIRLRSLTYLSLERVLDAHLALSEVCGRVRTVLGGTRARGTCCNFESVDGQTFEEVLRTAVREVLPSFGMDPSKDFDLLITIPANRWLGAPLPTLGFKGSHLDEALVAWRRLVDARGPVRRGCMPLSAYRSEEWEASWAQLRAAFLDVAAGRRGQGPLLERTRRRLLGLEQRRLPILEGYLERWNNRRMACEERRQRASALAERASRAREQRRMARAERQSFRAFCGFCGKTGRLRRRDRNLWELARQAGLGSGTGSAPTSDMLYNFIFYCPMHLLRITEMPLMVVAMPSLHTKPLVELWDHCHRSPLQLRYDIEPAQDLLLTCFLMLPMSVATCTYINAPVLPLGLTQLIHPLLVMLMPLALLKQSFVNRALQLVPASAVIAALGMFMLLVVNRFLNPSLVMLMPLEIQLQSFVIRVALLVLTVSLCMLDNLPLLTAFLTSALPPMREALRPALKAFKIVLLPLHTTLHRNLMVLKSDPLPLPVAPLCMPSSFMLLIVALTSAPLPLQVALLRNLMVPEVPPPLLVAPLCMLLNLMLLTVFFTSALLSPWVALLRILMVVKLVPLKLVMEIVTTSIPRLGGVSSLHAYRTHLISLSFGAVIVLTKPRRAISVTCSLLVSYNTTYTEATKILKHEAAWAMIDDPKRRMLYDTFMEQLWHHCKPHSEGDSDAAECGEDMHSCIALMRREMRWLTPPFPNKIFLKMILEPLPLLAQPAFCMLLLATSIPKAFGMNGLFLVLRTVTARPTPPFPNKIFRMLRHFCMLLLATGSIGRFLALCTFAARISSNFDAAPRLPMAWQTNWSAPRRSFNMMFVPSRRAVGESTNTVKQAKLKAGMAMDTAGMIKGTAAGFQAKGEGKGTFAVDGAVDEKWSRTVCFGKFPEDSKARDLIEFMEGVMAEARHSIEEIFAYCKKFAGGVALSIERAAATNDAERERAPDSGAVAEIVAQFYEGLHKGRDLETTGPQFRLPGIAPPVSREELTAAPKRARKKRTCADDGPVVEVPQTGALRTPGVGDSCETARRPEDRHEAGRVVAYDAARDVYLVSYDRAGGEPGLAWEAERMHWSEAVGLESGIARTRPGRLVISGWSPQAAPVGFEEVVLAQGVEGTFLRRRRAQAAARWELSPPEHHRPGHDLDDGASLRTCGGQETRVQGLSLRQKLSACAGPITIWALDYHSLSKRKRRAGERIWRLK
ncbi:unnamed protein product [Prorocentrum cordatum]|uniref:Uncharacterized protein n=1 Tax=Prorocentrum cordatum TaxID=2364126 RepID=A0ABN9SC66_9DINO|nr:unnamed protein product [Polarella glacialis]